MDRCFTRNASHAANVAVSWFPAIGKIMITVQIPFIGLYTFCSERIKEVFARKRRVSIGLVWGFVNESEGNRSKSVGERTESEGFYPATEIRARVEEETRQLKVWKRGVSRWVVV